MIKTKYLFVTLFFFSILACIWAYSPGLHGGYYLDDIVNIQKNNLLHIESLDLNELWQAMGSGESGHIKRIIPYLSFAINLYFSNESAFGLKATNLFIHILCSLCIFLLIYLLLRKNYLQNNINEPLLLAVLVSVLWMSHPFNLTSVLYIVQRMTSLYTLFSLLALISYVYLRLQQINGSQNWTRLITFPTIFSIFAIFSKESAILIPFYIILIELFILKFNSYRSRDANILKILVISSVLIPISSVSVFLITQPTWLSELYSLRDFSMLERIMTQSRVLVWYMKMIITPDLGHMGLLLDDFEISKSIFQPIATLYSILFLIFIVVLIPVLYKKHPLIAFGLSWFLVGHVLESTFLPLEMAFEHRNYMPSIGLLLAAIYTFRLALKRTKLLRQISYCLFFIWVSTLILTTHARSQHWKNPAVLALYDVENHPNSVRANLYATAVYVNLALNSAKNESQKTEYANQADKFILKAAKLDKTGASPDLARIIVLSVLDLPIDDSFIKGVQNKLATRKLDASTQSSLVSITDCTIEGFCKLTHNQYKILIDTMINNQHISNPTRASLILSKSRYITEMIGDFELATRFALEAINMDPNKIVYRFELARLYILMNDLIKAKNEIDTIRNLDKYNFYDYNCDTWENIILSKLNT